MSVLRQANILGQQRLDVPHLRAIESSISADFDLLAGSIMAGGSPLVVRGFDVITSGAIGNPASALQVNVANGIIMHPLASEHGTIFSVAADADAEVLSSTNPNVSGGFTAGQVNYVGLDLLRSADDSTADLVMFLDANSLAETPKSVPLARTLQYKIVVSTTDFASTDNILPLAKVTTDNTNTVTLVEDARPMTFRLGSGGSVPDRLHAYPWPVGRLESTSGTVFSGGDKSISSLKEWMDAMMTRVWEIGGGAHWYAPTADRNVNMIWTGATFTNGENFEWDGTNLHWKGLRFLFDNSTGNYNTVVDQTTNSTGLTNLADGECIYVDLDRTQNAALTAAKATLTSLGTPVVPGARYVIAWRVGTSIYTRNWRYAVGTTFVPATTTSLGVVKLYQTPGSAPQPVVLNLDANNTLSITAGASATTAPIVLIGATAFSPTPGLTATGGAMASSSGNTGAPGVQANGGAGGQAGTSNGGGSGISAAGGNGVAVTSSSVSPPGGHGGTFFGGSPGANSGTGGRGLAGDGIHANGSLAPSATQPGGQGAQLVGGSGGATGSGGAGATIIGGDTSLAAGNGGRGLDVYAGAPGHFAGTGSGGYGVQIYAGNGGAAGGNGGYGVQATGGSATGLLSSTPGAGGIFTAGSYYTTGRGSSIGAKGVTGTGGNGQKGFDANGSTHTGTGYGPGGAGGAGAVFSGGPGGDAGTPANIADQADGGIGGNGVTATGGTGGTSRSKDETSVNSWGGQGGVGGRFTGGAETGIGVWGTGGTGNFTSSAGGVGGKFDGGASTDAGDGGIGVVGTGGTSSGGSPGHGAVFTAGAGSPFGDADGVRATGTNAGSGVYGVGGNINGKGVHGQGGTGGYGVQATPGSGQAVAIRSEGHLLMSGAQPASNVDNGANTFSPAHFAKAWGLIRSNGSGGFQGTNGLLDGIGVSGVALSGSDIVITFSHAFANANYAITMSASQSGPKIAYTSATTTTQLTIKVYAMDGTTQINPASVVTTVSFACWGRH
jgi:hypothetical protein